MFHVKHNKNNDGNESRFNELSAILPNVSRETFECLETYAALLQQWQRRINLVANATLPILWQRHILDSAQLFPLEQFLKSGNRFSDGNCDRNKELEHCTVHPSEGKNTLTMRIRGEAPQAWLDVGSGAGFPGLVLAILAKHQGNAQVTLIESNGKKAAFLRMVAASLHLPVQILNQRIEASYDQVHSPDIITARALAELPKLLELIAPFFGEQTLALLQKGQGFAQEIEQARRDWQFDVTCHPSLIDEESTILAISNLQSR